nr:immunoglobulin light chain junction region [Macaca mulatta]
CMQYTHIPLTF